MPKRLPLGLGRVSPSRSLFNTFFCCLLTFSAFSFTLAPVYKASPSGMCLVVLQAAKRRVSSRQLAVGSKRLPVAGCLALVPTFVLRRFFIAGCCLLISDVGLSFIGFALRGSYASFYNSSVALFIYLFYCQLPTVHCLLFIAYSPLPPPTGGFSFSRLVTRLRLRKMSAKRS